jgi:hypothetical protein
MKGKPPVKVLDMVIILLALGLTGFSAFAVYAKPQNAVYVRIEGPAQQWQFPLDAEETVAVTGPLGDTIIRIHNKEAWVESSPCDNKVCIAGGHLHTRGEWLACLPNTVFLLIEGNGEAAYAPDAATW